MLLTWLLAALHLTALVVGSAAVLARARALAVPLDTPALKRVFVTDAWWGIAALLWVATGLWRLLGSTEKPTVFYLESRAFWLKMALFVLVVLLEAWPATTLTRWRIALRRGESVDTSRAPALARISRVQLGLVVAIVFVATAMARGVGY